MPESSLPTKGRFVWYDLRTSDPEKSKAFYTRLFGWGTRDDALPQPGPYTMWLAGQKGLGGMVPLKKENQRTSHWIAYVTVPNVDITVEKARKMGAAVLVAGRDIPGVGRFAVIKDPQGATISPFTFAGEAMPEAEDPPTTGHFCWNELLTTSPQEARQFYSELFDWAVGEQDLGELGTYWLYRRGAKEEAGMMLAPEDADTPPAWLPYVSVEDVDATAARAEKLGGKVHHPPTDVAGLGRFAVLVDPTGAFIAIFKPGLDREGR